MPLTIKEIKPQKSQNRGGKRDGAGRKRGDVNLDKREVVEIFREASPHLLRLAIKRAEGYEIEVDGQIVRVPGDNGILKELVKKALPDNINLGLDTDTVRDFISAILTHRPVGALSE